MVRSTLFTAAIGLTLCACGPQRPAIDPALESGVTSSNGGGARAAGGTSGLNQINIGPNGAQVTPSNQAGRAY